MPQGLYLPEGMLIDTAQNAHYTSSESALATAMSSGAIIEGIATMCDLSHNLICDIDGKKGIIHRENAIYELSPVKAKEIAIISKVGKPVCFKVIGYEDGMYILSRKAAQEEALKYFLENLCPGNILRGKVTHCEPFGAFVDIGCGNIALLGIENISVSRISSPKERFFIGQQINVAIKQIEADTGRISLTHKELLGTWEENAARFAPGETVRGIVRGVEDYGVFIELTPNLSGLAEVRENVEVGMAVSVYIKSILPDRMKIKLLIIDVLENATKKPISSADYYIKEGTVEVFKYTPENARGKLSETNFKDM